MTALIQSLGHGAGHRQLSGPVFIIGVVSRNQTIAPKNFFHGRFALVVWPRPAHGELSNMPASMKRRGVFLPQKPSNPRTHDASFLLSPSQTASPMEILVQICAVSLPFCARCLVKCLSLALSSPLPVCKQSVI